VSGTLANRRRGTRRRRTRPRAVDASRARAKRKIEPIDDVVIRTCARKPSERRENGAQTFTRLKLRIGLNEFSRA
jgi:hypothetical protein